MKHIKTFKIFETIYIFEYFECLYDTFKKEGIYVFSLNDDRIYKFQKLLDIRGDEYRETSQCGTDVTFYNPKSEKIPYSRKE